MRKKNFRRIICGFFVLLLLFPNGLTAFAGNPEDPRQVSDAVGDGGAVATEHPDASEAATSILKKGGNAVDAAIAAAAVQGVTRPFSGGLGGGGIMNVYLKEEDRFVILDHRVESSANFGPESFIDPDTGLVYSSSERISSGMATAVPSAVKAWEQSLEEYGTMSLSEVLQPAIKVAEEGFIADANYVRETRENASRFRMFESTQNVYLNEDGSVPEEGTIMKNPDMAKTYRLIAENGSEVFYEGEIADAIIDTVQNPPVKEDNDTRVVAGNLTKEDLNNYEVLTHEPTHVNYHGYDVYSTPPSSSGGTTIGLALNILEPYNISEQPETMAYHYMMEATRYAFADRRTFLGDPKYTKNPVDGLLSKGYAEERRRNIMDDRASVGQVAPGNPWPYDEDPSKEPEPPIDAEHAFYYDFAGENGAPWSERHFRRIDTGTTTSPNDSSFTLQDNTGVVEVNERQDGRGSAYGRVAPIMRVLDNGDVLMRFRIDELGTDQRLRLWLQSDVWGSGSTMPANGYGLELSAEDNSIRFNIRKDGSSNNLSAINTDLTTDWQWLRFRSDGDQLSAKLWSDDQEEPTEWDLTHDITANQQLENEYGRMMFSIINFDYDKKNKFYFDDITVEDVNDLPEEPEQPEEPEEPEEPVEGNFVYEFDGEAGAAWDTEKFQTINEGVLFDLDEDGGRMKFENPPGSYNTSFGKAIPVIDELKNSELTMRFNAGESNGDKRLRLWMRAADWRSARSTLVDSGYGIEINPGSNTIDFNQMGSNSTNTLATINHEWTNDWVWIKLRFEEDQLKVRLWNDNEDEPEEWDIEEINDQWNDAGKTLIGVHDLEPTGEGSFHISNLTIENLDTPQTEEVNEVQTQATSTEEESAEEDEAPAQEEFESEESTIHLSVTDNDGNIVSYTSTIVSIGGNGMVVPGYGFLLNNALYGRTPSQSPDHPNYPKPSFRSLSSMSPTIVMKDGEPVITLGAPGSDTIITTVLQVILNHVDFGMTLPEAIAAPRITQRNNIDSRAQYEEIHIDKIDSLISELEEMGHLFKPDTRIQGIGSVTGLEFLSDGTVRAAAEPVRRGGGSAMAIDRDDIEEPIEEVEKEALQSLVSDIDAENLQEADYTEESWSALASALEAARGVLADEDATQVEVDAAFDALEAARKGLVPVEDPEGADKTALQGKVDEVKDLNASDYTEESWAPFASALETAREVLADEDATQAEVDTALDELEAAHKGLKAVEDPTDPEEADKSALQEKVDEVKGLNAADYTEESWATLVLALEAAEDILAKEDATQAEVDRALEALVIAHKGLQLVEDPTDPEEVDKSALQSKVDEANKLNASDYTADSWSAFAKALETAEKVLANEDATQAEVDAALVKLLAAWNCLEEKSSKPGDDEDPGKGDKDKGKDPGKGDDKDSGKDGDGSKDGDKLPSTATSYYNWMLAGLALMVLAAVVWQINRRRRAQ